MSLLTAEYRLVRAGGLAAAGLACWYWLRPGGGLGRALIRGSGWVLRRWLGLPAMGAAAESGTSDLLRLGEHERDLLHMLNASFDLVTIVEVRDNTARRVYSSQSHKTLLGHEPESCNGDMTTLTHLFTEEFLHLQVPLLIAAFEEGSLIDGFTDNVKLLNAAGQTMKFEYRMSLSPTDPRKALLIFRLKPNAVGPSPMRR